MDNRVDCVRGSVGVGVVVLWVEWIVEVLPETEETNKIRDPIR